MTLAIAAAPSSDTTIKTAESVVLGANVTVLLGEATQEGRLGFGLDAGYQVQRFPEVLAGERGDYVVWAEERPDLNFGPAAHVWHADGAWNAGLGLRAGVMWPLRMGLDSGWWPGPGLTAEVGPSLSTSGYVGIDVQGAVDLPWLQGRVATTWTRDAFKSPRLHLGAFVPLEQPTLWDTPSAVWDPSDLEG